MKNHITESIFETAATLPNKEAVAAINQLLIEASSQFKGVVPNGFHYDYTSTQFGPFYKYAFFSKIESTGKVICGIGHTPKLAYKALIKNTAEWFANPSDSTDKRTEIAA